MVIRDKVENDNLSRFSLQLMLICICLHLFIFCMKVISEYLNL